MQEQVAQEVALLPAELWDLILYYFRKGLPVRSWLPLTLVCRTWHRILMNRLFETGKKLAELDQEQYLSLFKQDQEIQLRKLREQEISRVLEIRGEDDSDPETKNCKFFDSRTCKLGEECPWLHIQIPRYTADVSILSDQSGIDPISKHLQYLSAYCGKIRRVRLPSIARPFHAQWIPASVTIVHASFLTYSAFDSWPMLREWHFHPLEPSKVIAPISPCDQETFAWNRFTLYCTLKIWLKHRLWELLPNLTGLHFIFSSDVYADTSTDAASFGTLPKYLTRLNIALHTFGTARVDLQKLVASLTSTYPALQDIIVSEHRTRYWSKSTAGSYVHWDSKRGVIKKKTRW